MANGKVETFGEAIGILVQAAQVGQSKGVFTLQEAALIAQALEQVDAFKAQVEANQAARAAAPTETPAPADVAQG